MEGAHLDNHGVRYLGVHYHRQGGGCWYMRGCITGLFLTAFPNPRVPGNPGGRQQAEDFASASQQRLKAACRDALVMHYRSARIVRGQKCEWAERVQPGQDAGDLVRRWELGEAAKGRARINEYIESGWRGVLRRRGLAERKGVIARAARRGARKPAKDLARVARIPGYNAFGW